MKTWAIEGKADVPGGRVWLLWSGTHFYRTKFDAEKAMEKLNHKAHPIPWEFRVTEYGPTLDSQSDAGAEQR